MTGYAWSGSAAQAGDSVRRRDRRRGPEGRQRRAHTQGHREAEQSGPVDRRAAQPSSPSCMAPPQESGVSLALACDIVLASDKAFFMLAFTKIGLMPDGGASAWWPRRSGCRIRPRCGWRCWPSVRRPPRPSTGLVTAGTIPPKNVDAEVDKVLSTLVGTARSSRFARPRRPSTPPRTELESGVQPRVGRAVGVGGVEGLPGRQAGIPAAPPAQIH